MLALAHHLLLPGLDHRGLLSLLRRLASLEVDRHVPYTIRSSDGAGLSEARGGADPSFGPGSIVRQ
jgi:hypothetical protein